MPETTQTVAPEANGAATPAPAAPSSAPEPDLDSLLAEFSTPKQPEAVTPEAKPATTPEAHPVAPPANPGLENRVNALESELLQRDLDKATNAVKRAMGDSGAKLSDKMILNLIQGEAANDMRLRQAWMQRYQNPAAFEKVLDGLGKKFGKELSNAPDTQVTDDKAAVRAAVRTVATGSAPTQDFDPKAWVALTPAQRSAAKRKMAGG